LVDLLPEFLLLIQFALVVSFGDDFKLSFLFFNSSLLMLKDFVQSLLIFKLGELIFEVFAVLACELKSIVALSDLFAIYVNHGL